MKKFISVLLTITMLFSMATAVLAADRPTKEYPQNFWDVPKTHWAFPYIAELVDKGVLAGYEDGSFQPDNTVTRAEWAKIMVLAAGLPASDNNIYFADMANHWANIYVNTAKNYLAAYTDGTFKPDHSAVREDVTVSMVKLKGYDISKVDYSYLNQFTDMNSISNSLKAYVAVAVQKELISGFEDNTFRGQDTLTRAEAATLLWRAFQYGNDNKVVDTPNTTTPVQTPNTPSTTPNTTPAPIQTPTPTEKPQHTPDANITETPEPTPETTPEPTIKPYKIDTIGKANIDNEYLYTEDSNNTIYYVENNKVFSVNLSGNKSELFDIETLTKREDFTEEEFNVNSICYDIYTNRLLIYGEYGSGTYQHSNCLFEITNGQANLVSDDLHGALSTLVTVLSNGNYVFSSYVSDTYIIDVNTCSVEDFDGTKVSDYKTVTAVEQGNDLLYVDKNGGAYKFNFVNNEELYYNSTSSFCLNGYVAASNGKFIIKPFNSNEIFISEDDYEVVDRAAVGSCLSKFFLTKDNSIIFYDTSAKAFRMISKNN